MTSPLAYLTVNTSDDEDNTANLSLKSHYITPVTAGTSSSKSTNQSKSNEVETDFVRESINTTEQQQISKPTVFGDFDFSKSSDSPQWPTLENAPPFKSYRVKRKEGVQWQFPIKVLRDGLKDVFSDIGSKLDIKDTKKMVVSYPLKHSDGSAQVMHLAGWDKELIGTLETFYCQTENECLLEVEFMKKKAGSREQRPAETKRRKMVSHGTADETIYKMLQKNPEIAEAYMEKRRYIATLLGDADAVNFLSPVSYLCHVKHCSRILKLKSFSSLSSITEHWKNHSEDESCNVLVRRHNYMKDTAPKYYWKKDVSVEELEVKHDGAETPLAIKDLMQGNLIVKNDQEFKGKHNLLSDAVLRKIINRDPTALESVPQTNTIGMLKLTKVSTPDLHPPLKSDGTLYDIQKGLVEEFEKHDRWTTECTRLLSNNVSALYKYDRLDYCMSRAYGNVLYKVLINPKMVLCYHPSCLSKGSKPVSLKNILDISSYIKKHLKDHSNDRIGVAMDKRFSALLDNIFITDEELDSIAVSPFVLNAHVTLNAKTVHHFENYGINRELGGAYICHWKAKIIAAGIIKESSLTFQEDEALIFSILKFPDPIKDWSVWGTLSLYCTKMLTSINSAALNLYRGITRSRVTRSVAPNVNEYCAEINHLGPSVSVSQKNLPGLNYDPQVWHKGELIFHLKVMEKNEGSIVISRPKVKRIPATIGADEQEINQGAFIHNNKLCGLKKAMSVDDVKSVGLSKLGDYISTENGFIICVREYRLTDFNGYMNTNIFTSFEAETMNSETCNEQLQKVLDYSRSCLSCLLNGYKCEYERIDVQCTKCLSKGCMCVSFVPFHVLWDMGSAHKKTKSISTQIQLDSSECDMLSPLMCTIGFGGLHLCKAITNAIRNHILTHKGNNYGMNIFRAVRKVSEMLQWVKQAVYVAKDRQSDLLSFLTSCPLVQKALRKEESYHVRRVPEPVLNYTANARTQKEIISPVSVATNRNGDVFVLDTGAACVHVIDRCVVSKVFFIGNYNNSSVANYGSGVVTANKAKFSNQLVDMISSDTDNIYILDEGREEIVVVMNVMSAKSVKTRKIHLITFKGVSLAHAGTRLAVLMQNDGVSTIKFITPLFPASRKYRLHIDYETIFTISSQASLNLKQIFTVNEKVLGVVDVGNNVHTYHLSGKKLREHRSTGVVSGCKPCINVHGQLCVLNDREIHTYVVDSKEIVVKKSKVIPVVDNTKNFHSWGEVMYIVKKVTSTSHSVEEIGSLTFGVYFCHAINSFYEAISYSKPGHGEVLEKLTLQQAIDKAAPLVDLLKDMQKSLTTKFSRTSFQGDFGSPWSATIDCIVETVESWKALQHRLNYFDQSLSDKVYPHAVTNESVVEHTFGFTMKKGQGHLQDMEEYVQSKRRHTVDFQIRMTDTPFCQYTKTKVRDKGYQSLVDVGKIKLSAKDINEIFKVSKTKDMSEAVELEETEENFNLLRKAYIFTKSVPRQSNRCKWRERSGFQPNLLLEVSDVGPGHLLAGDMVFSRGLDEELEFLLLQESVSLNGKVQSVEVCPVKQTSNISVLFTKLVLDQGQIATVPSSLFEMQEDGDVTFDEQVTELINSITRSHVVLHSEEEWATIMDDMEPMEHIDIASLQQPVPENEPVPTSSGMQKKRKHQYVQNEETRKRRRLKSKLDDDDGDGDDGDEGDEGDDGDGDGDDDDIVPVNNMFYIIRLMSKKVVQHFIGLADSSQNDADLFWMQFMRQIEPTQFVFKTGDCGLVSSDEIVKQLDYPQDDVMSSSRSGKVKFDLEQLRPYLKTLH